MACSNNHVWVFGGFSSKGVLGDLYLLDLKTFEWEKIRTNGDGPEASQGASMIAID